MDSGNENQTKASVVAATYIHVGSVSSILTPSSVKFYLDQNAPKWAADHFGPSISTQIFVAEGSIIGRVLVAVASLNQFIADDDSFRHGVECLVADAKTFSGHVIEQFRANYRIADEAVIRAERRVGIPGKMQRFFTRLDRLTYNRLKHRDREAEILLLRKKYLKIIELLNDETDRRLFEEAVNQEAQVTPEPPALPDNLPADWPDPVFPRSYRNFVARITGPEKGGRRD